MKVLMKYVKINNDILGEEDTFLLVSYGNYYEYDKIAKKPTDIILGTKYTVIVYNPKSEILYEKLEIKIPGSCTIANVKCEDNIECKFDNLQLSIGNMEYGKAELRATADKIKLITSKTEDQEQIKGQIKLKM